MNKFSDTPLNIHLVSFGGSKPNIIEFIKQIN